MRFRTIFLIIALAEIVSLAGHFFPELNTAGFLAIAIAALILCMKRLEYGLYFVLAELILGGKGYLCSFDLQGVEISLRMALFVIVMAVWLSKLKIKDFKSKIRFLRWWGVLGIAIVWGLAIGLLRGNSFDDLFLDANGYFYIALILPFLWTVKVQDFWKNLGVVFFAATTWIAFETLFLVYLWTHGLSNYVAANLRPVYEWIRNTGVGEITWLEGNFARVFFQSHIYNVAAFFILLARSKKLSSYTLLTINTAVILTALSRSFWAGVIVGLVVLIILIRQRKQVCKRFIIAAMAAVLLLFIIARFPLPRPSDMDLSFLQDRSNITTDTAASRWNLLPVLTNAALEHPVVGSGFGRTVTYISNDPRIREVNISGEYTTYAFEWGWIDIWLKTGLLGLIAFIGLLTSLAYQLYKAGKLSDLAVLTSLTVIHFFTPYLNHPLGIGVLILVSIHAIMEV